jgi:hypothetical protein
MKILGALILMVLLNLVAQAAPIAQNCAKEERVPDNTKGRITIYIGGTERAYRVCRQSGNGRPGVATQILADGVIAGELPFSNGGGRICLDVSAKKIEIQESDNSYLTGETYQRLCP